MPEFISRPNFGPASSLWEKAIQLVAQRSNPMAEGINAGLDTMGQGLQMGASAAMQKSGQAHTEKMQGNQFDQAKQELYRAHVADLALKGQLSPMVAPEKPTGYWPDVASANPAGVAAMTMPEGAKLTTHQLAGILGVQPAGENMAIMGPRNKMDDWMKQYTFKKSMGSGADQSNADARSMLNAWMKDNTDATDEEISYAFSSFLKIAKAAQGGAMPTKPAAKPAEEEPGPGLFSRIYNYATGTTSKPAAKKEGRAPIGSLFKK